MDIKALLASRLKNVQESSTLKMNSMARELAAKGHKVINLTAGEPDFAVPASVKSAAIKAIQDDFSKYTAVSGIPELRNAIAKKLKNENALEYKPEEIVVTMGAKQALFNFFMATLNEGDEVIIPAPYWVSYPEMVKVAGGVPVILETTEALNFKITPEQLKSAVTSKTKAFIFNSPSNPTGMSYSRSEMLALAKVLEGSKVLVVSDEIYEKLLYVGEFCSFATLSADAFSRTLTINGFSKAFAMTGWRLGYAAGPVELIQPMVLLQGQSTSNATSIIQKAALVALDLRAEAFREIVDIFQKRRESMAAILADCKLCSFAKPDGAFYFFVNIERLIGKTYNKEGREVRISSSEDLAFYLLESAQVVTVPGTGFGAPMYLRLSFAVSDHDVVEGATKFVRAIEVLK